jgi:hypothetical protein
LFVSAEPAVVGLRANHEHKVSGIELIKHPARPTLRRRAIHVLVEQRLDAVRAEPLGEGEHFNTMLRRVVAVADEGGDVAHARSGAGFLRMMRSASSSSSLRRQ